MTPLDTSPEYRAARGLSWSTLWPLATSPAYYRWRLAHPLTPTPAMRRGTLAHLATLEPSAYDATVVVAPPAPHRTSNAGKAAHEGRAALDAVLADAKKLPDADALATLYAYAEHVDAVAGGDVWSVSPDEDALSRAIAGAVRAHPLAGLLLSEAVCETPIYWTDGDRACKALPDALVLDPSDGLRWALNVDRPILADLKVLRSVDGLSTTIARSGYHGQLAHYAAAVRAEHGPDPVRVIIAVEAAAPHDVVVAVLDEAYEAVGDALRSRLLSTLAACEASDEWPGRSPGPVVVEPPRWLEPEPDEGLDLGGLDTGGEY